MRPGEVAGRGAVAVMVRADRRPTPTVGSFPGLDGRPRGGRSAVFQGFSPLRVHGSYSERKA